MPDQTEPPLLNPPVSAAPLPPPSRKATTVLAKSPSSSPAVLRMPMPTSAPAVMMMASDGVRLLSFTGLPREHECVVRCRRRPRLAVR